MLSEIQHGICRLNTGNLYLQFKFRAAIQSFGLQSDPILSTWPILYCFPPGWRENALKLKQHKDTKFTSYVGPSLQGDKDGQGHVNLSVCVQPLGNPKTTAFPDMILQRDASCWEYDSCLTVQSHSLPIVITPCIC